MSETESPALLEKLAAHFGQDCSGLPVLERAFPRYERANLHQGLEGLLEKCENRQLVGVITSEDYHACSLAKLTRPRSASSYDEGPVEYVDETIPGGRSLGCVKRGLYLFQYRGQPLVVLIDEERFTSNPGIRLEVMGSTKESGEDFLRLISREVQAGKAFRGGVLSLSSNCYGSLELKFHQLPEIKREEVILPEELLRRIERHTLDFSAHAERLKASGRHLKRGILLHGPPGTGKTFSAMYLASRLEGRTVFLLTGGSMGIIEQAVAMARVLQPATLILEDVDLVGTERGRQQVGANAILFELLNQMDGLADDADLLFILTTNRPDELEPALASRPGRIDQAIEIPLPDEDCRRRLMQLYGQGLKVESVRMDEFVKRMEGVSAAFVRELLRKAAVFAAIEQEGEIVVGDDHLDLALKELLVTGGGLTRKLLGASTPI